MIHALVAFVFILASAFRHRHGLALENLALRQQLAVYQRRHPRPRLRSRDRIFPVWLSKDTTGAQACSSTFRRLSDAATSRLQGVDCNLKRRMAVIATGRFQNFTGAGARQIRRGRRSLVSASVAL